MINLTEGQSCTLNGTGDLAMDSEARRLIGQRCVFVRLTKAGLAQVRLESDTKHTVSVPQRNVEDLQ